MILKRLNESKPKDVPDIELTNEESTFAQEVKDLDYKFENLKNNTIRSLRNIFIFDMEPEKVDAEEFLDWFYLSGNSFLEFVCDNYDLIPLTSGGSAKSELSVYTIRDLAENEDMFTDALRKVAIKWKLIDEEGKDLVTPESNHVLTTGELVETLFNVKDKALLKDLVKALLATQGLVNESLEETEEDEPAPEGVTFDLSDGTGEPKEVTIEPTPVLEEPHENVPEAVFADMVNSTIQKEWELISYLNSLVATFDYDYQEDNKEDVLGIFNQLIDDTTINIGMLHKSLELISTKTATLLDAGEEKAEEVVSEPAKDLK